MDHIEVKDIGFKYPKSRLPVPLMEDLSLNVSEGGLVSVVARPKAGKSTLARIIAGLQAPDSGEVLLSGELVDSPTPRLSLASRDPYLLGWRTAKGNVMLSLEIAAPDMPRNEREERALDLLQLVDLDKVADVPPPFLPNSMRKRIALCRALAHYPEVLILDEPFVGLNAFGRLELWYTLAALRMMEPFSCVFFTQDILEAAFLSDEIYIMGGFPSRIQEKIDVPLGPDRDIKELHSTKGIALIAKLWETMEAVIMRDKMQLEGGISIDSNDQDPPK